MKRWIVLALLFVSVPCHAADVKITALTEATAVTNDDLLLIVDAPAGTATSKKITITNFLGSGLAATFGAVTATSITVSKSSGVAGDMGLYEANSTDTHGAGFRGPASITGDGAYRILFPNARAAAANSCLVVTNSGESGTGTASDPYIQTGSWLALPSNPIGGTLGATTNVIPKANGTGTATLQASGITEDGTKVDIGTLNLVTTGQISGRVPVVADADGKTLSGTDLYGSMQLATGAGTWVIPDVDAAAGTGQSFCIYATGAYEIVIDGNAEDKIRLNGVLGAAGGDITNNTAEAAGDFICLMLTDFSSDVAHWTTLGYKGTWTVVP